MECAADARDELERWLELTYRRAVRARAVAEEMDALADDARARLAAVAEPDDGADLPMARLALRLGLDAEQVELVWTAVACSIDGRLVAHLEALGGAHARRGLSPALFATLAERDDASTSRLAHWLASPNPLVADGLLVPAGDGTPAARAYAAAARLVSYLAGEPHPIEPLRIVRPAAGLLHDARQSAAIDELAAALGRAVDAVFVLEGPLGSGRTSAAAQACGEDVVVLDLARLAPDQLGDALIALRREAGLRDAVPVLANVDHMLGEDRREQHKRIGELVDGVGGPLIATAGVAGADLGTTRPVIRIRWEVADTEVRAALWSRAVASIGAGVEGDLSALAHRYRVGPAAIRRAVASVELVRPSGAPVGETALVAGLRHNISERLGGLAQRVEVTQSWDDLVVADDIGDLIAALIGRIRHAHHVLDRWGYRSKIARGAGVAALFSGPPGTGKTMVAGLIARELGLELYQVDLSKVVSKWVGETEKNLARVFDAADEGHALLLFDEADALFGQRSAQLSGANDRYANLEVNYLLQRVEAFAGITVLTTNLETAIDGALKRRLAAHIVFTTPDEDERAKLWRHHTDTGAAPLTRTIDHADLARLFPAMTGANIRNASIAAAFLAAGDGSPTISHDHLLRAARAEYRSMGHMVSDALASRRHTPRSL